MMRSIMATIIAACVLVGITQARAEESFPSEGRYPAAQWYNPQPLAKKIVHRKRYAKRAASFRVARRSRGGARGVTLAGVTPVLKQKADEIVAACGSVVTSAVASRPYRSNHPGGRAVDLQGNPSCIYSHLRGWRGGYSTDYAAVRHVHISWNPGGQEWGVRFAHRNPFFGHRYARRQHRVASR